MVPATPISCASPSRLGKCDAACSRRAASDSAVGGSSVRNRSDSRTQPMSRLVAQRTPSGPPAISSVLPPPMSDTRTGPSGGRAEVTPRKVIRASSSPVSTRVVNP